MNLIFPNRDIERDILGEKNKKREKYKDVQTTKQTDKQTDGEKKWQWEVERERVVRPTWRKDNRGKSNFVSLRESPRGGAGGGGGG